MRRARLQHSAGADVQLPGVGVPGSEGVLQEGGQGPQGDRREELDHLQQQQQ